MHKVAVILGIRPDFIRTSEVLRLLREHPEVDLQLIHTGQHYQHNLNSIFFDELEIPAPDWRLGSSSDSHCQQHAYLIESLEPVLKKINPDICLFLGDANAVIGCITPLKLGIPIAHIEAGMRSFDWRMPEERNRVIIDRVSDVLYVYHENYKINLVREGICPSKIVNVGNVIQDVVDKWKHKAEWEDECCVMCDAGVCSKHQIRKHKYALQTLHRNEHVDFRTASRILLHVGRATQKRNLPVVFIEMPRIKKLGLVYPENYIVKEPQGFFDFLRLERYANIEYTDSGTNQEVAAILGVPSVITRRCTERPETFAVGNQQLATDPDEIEMCTSKVFTSPGGGIRLGENSSEKIVKDLVRRLPQMKMRRQGFYPPWIDEFKRKNFTS